MYPRYPASTPQAEPPPEAYPPYSAQPPDPMADISPLESTQPLHVPPAVAPSEGQYAPPPAYPAAQYPQYPARAHRRGLAGAPAYPASSTSPEDVPIGYSSPAPVYEVPPEQMPVPRRPVYGTVEDSAAFSAQAVRPLAPRVAASSNPWWGISKVHYVVGVIEVLLAIRFVLELFAANSKAFFSGLIYTVTNPLVAPFAGVFGNSGGGGHVFAADAIVAGIVYALLAWGINSLLRLRYDRQVIQSGETTTRRTSHLSSQDPPPVPPTRNDGVLP